MQQTAPLLDPDKLYQSLNADLQRRIESMGRTTPQTFGVLEIPELLFLALSGVLGPLLVAWWML